jgi:EAL domain-containing protein (putative c-di-GMP-specific phosphodiesterase class I)
MRHNKCNQFEALIRYWNNGRLTGPTFLDTIEKAGMAPVVDLWVCHQVHNDMSRWQEEGFEPEISINLHPDTLRNTEMVKKILSIMGEKRVRFEIIERSFLDQDSAAKNLSLLQQHSISIDDFGYGYSNLETLLNLKIDELKLDRTLIQKIDEPKGQAVCRNITRFCHEIGIEVVAEGVETEEQKKLVVEMGIDTIQGWYYSQAIPFDKIKPYAETFGTVEKKKDKKQSD